MPDEPQTMTAWMPQISRRSRLYWVPVSVPYVASIKNEAHYQAPQGDQTHQKTAAASPLRTGAR
jgi:hypothetical protein